MSKRGKLGFAFMFALIVLAMPSVVHAPPPVIATPTITPSSPTYNDKVTVSVNVTTNHVIQNVTIVYTTDHWKTINSTLIASYNSTTTMATTTIPALPTGGTVTYYVVAYDNRGVRTVNNNSGNYFSYNVTAPPVTSTTSNWIVYSVLGVVMLIVAIACVKILRSSPKSNPPRSN